MRLIEILKFHEIFLGIMEFGGSEKAENLFSAICIYIKKNQMHHFL